MRQNVSGNNLTSNIGNKRGRVHDREDEEEEKQEEEGNRSKKKARFSGTSRQE